MQAKIRDLGVIQRQKAVGAGDGAGLDGQCGQVKLQTPGVDDDKIVACAAHMKAGHACSSKRLVMV